MRASNTRRRPGNVVVAVAVSLVTLLSCVALAVDGGMMHDRRRQVQAAADAAALSAASDLYYHWSQETGSDGGGTARAAAVNTVKLNGYEDGVNGNTVVVNIPPQSGPFTGQKAYAEVIVTYSHARYFSKIFGTQPIPVRARAVARGRKSTTGNAILVLDPDDKASLSTGGNGFINVTGSAVQVNSANGSAMIANGGGSFGSPNLDVTGGYTTPGGGSIAGPVTTGTDPIPDPLAYLPPPDITTLPIRSTKTLKYQHGNHTLQPGVYYGGVNITSDASVTLEPGIYYMKNGGFNWGGSGSLTGNGIFMYLDPGSNSDKINLTGNGVCNLSPMTTGTYQGILFWQRRDSTNEIAVQGNGNMTIKGTFYAAGGQLNIQGNSGVNMIGSQYIADNMVVGGNGTLNISWTPADTPGVREIALVE
jgi:hypothetical protein